MGKAIKMLPVPRTSKASNPLDPHNWTINAPICIHIRRKYVYSLCVGTTLLWMRIFSDMTFVILMARQVRSQQTPATGSLGHGQGVVASIGRRRPDRAPQALVEWLHGQPVPAGCVPD
jgi:hypothetical protein